MLPKPLITNPVNVCGQRTSGSAGVLDRCEQVSKDFLEILPAARLPADLPQSTEQVESMNMLLAHANASGFHQTSTARQVANVGATCGRYAPNNVQPGAATAVPARPPP